MQLSKCAHATILNWARRHPNIEVTGFVKQRGAEHVVVPMRNVHKKPDRYYAWDAADMQEQWSAMDREGSEPLAYYHSHPTGRPDPSETDMQGAMNVGMVYLIAYPENGEWFLSAWMCIEPGILLGELLEVMP